MARPARVHDTPGKSTEQRDGTAVQWMEKVSDEQYNGVLSSPQQQPHTPAQAVQAEQTAPASNRQQGTTKPSGELQPRIAPGLATLPTTYSTVDL